MAEKKPTKPLWRAAEIAALSRPYTQKLNANSLFRASGISRFAGMERAHVSLVRLPPGKDSFAYHAHEHEEEWIYIISGRAEADIGGETYEVGPGDFMGFTAPSAPHLLRNSFDEECVYLMGGEDKPIDIVSYPELDKRYLLRRGDKGVEFYELGDPTNPFGRAE